MHSDSISRYLSNKIRSDLESTLFSCCPNRQWVSAMMANLPAATDDDKLIEMATTTFMGLESDQWLATFATHPKIGDQTKSHQKIESKEQSGMSTAPNEIQENMRNLNVEYERKFGFIYLVCATGKSGHEMVSDIRNRLLSSRKDELHKAALEQTKITAIRLRNLV
uniref:2-oxo-4-hydroxy-4-carboxy-5-ureidoimidazoline decarboxylase n=1 Tax=Spongospora subterranea TaxID=70186 RepID=A0A0H5RBI7_9EUKA|eukprot:CRZ05809.1 hypothetical protein [Spongospora subterranea]